MEKFFAGEAFTKDEIMTGLKVGMHEGTLAPVVCGSALTGLGTEMLLSTIVDLVPGPQEMPAETGTDESGENSVEVKRDPNGFLVTDTEMRTNIPGIFAAGDIRSKLCRQVITAAGDGATAAQCAFVFLEQLHA